MVSLSLSEELICKSGTGRENMRSWHAQLATSKSDIAGLAPPPGRPEPGLDPQALAEAV